MNANKHIQVNPVIHSYQNLQWVKTIGYILLILSCLSFVMIPVVPFLGFSGMKIAGITTGLIIAGEVLFYLSLFILGKSFYEKIKSKLKFRKSGKTDANSQPQSDSVQTGISE